MPTVATTQNHMDGVKKVFQKNWKRIIRKKDIAYCVIFFFLSLAGWFHMPSGFCVCFAIALCINGEKLYASIAGIVLGSIFQFLWGAQVSWWNAIAAISLLMLRDYRWPEGTALSAISALILMPGSIIYGIAWQYTKQEWILTAMMLLLAGGMMPALNKAVEWLVVPESREHHEEDALCIVIPILLLVTGMATTSILSLNMGYACAIFLALVSADIFSPAPAMSFGFLCGAVLLVDGHGPYWLFTLPLIGGFRAVLHGKRRWVCAVLSLLISLLTTYIMAGKAHTVPIVCTLAGSAVWMFFPAKYLKTLTIAMQKTSMVKKSDNPYLEQKMIQLTHSMEKLSSAIPKPILASSDPEEVAEELMENLCEKCDRMLICWRDHYAERKAQFLEKSKEILIRGNPEDAVTGCMDPDGMMFEASRIVKKEQEKQKRLQQVNYEQEMLNTHFTAIGEIVKQRIDDGIREAGEEKYQEKQISELLEYIHFPATVQYIKKRHDHFTLSLRMTGSEKRMIHTDFLEKHISQRLGRAMYLFERKDKMLLFEEIPVFTILRGTASACAVSPERKDITPYAVENGDAVTEQTIFCGMEMTALSDGMGHGKGAGYESKKTLELLSLCLEAGYTSEQAIRAVNGMMLSATGGERFATVDMCTVDLWTGRTTLHKLGANLSLVIQGQNIHAIEGEALPLGIIEHVIPMKHEMNLGDGDTILLFSDGVTDAFDTEEAMSTLIRRYIHLGPQQIADSMLQDALIQSGGLPADDMTVVCIRIEQRKHKNR